MMKAGKYWIGDLCYVMHEEWDEVCAITMSHDECLKGEFTLKNGVTFAMYNTAYGDGCYDGFSVDSGTIGCVLLEDIDVSNANNCIGSGKILVFENDFETWSDDGLICFGDVIRIDTEADDYSASDDWNTYGEE